jgi:hypothetical protein
MTDPSRKPFTNQLGTRAGRAGSHDRMADFVGSTACPWWPLGMPRRPPSPRSKGRTDRPARQSQEGRTTIKASVSFAGNLTDDPGGAALDCGRTARRAPPDANAPSRLA